MAIGRFLAMTGAEISKTSPLPEKIAWMGCHFSLCSQGLSNLPSWLPEGSILMLDDAAPFDGHDFSRIAGELEERVRALNCQAVLLDLQRPGVEAVQALARFLALPCPVAVTAAYAAECPGPVLLPPLPCHVPLADWLAPWAGREIWLELALDGETITLTDKGAQIAPAHPGEGGFEDKKLHCHYGVTVEEESAVFKLWRTLEDLDGLVAEAEKLGVQNAVGLYQELSVRP